MKLVLSPARSILPAPWRGPAPTRPLFGDKTRALVELMSGYSPWELESLLGTSPGLALEAHRQYGEWPAAPPAGPALLCYQGLAYRYLDAASLSDKDLAFAGERLRLFSALYGLLRPADPISPYRLELQSRVRVEGKPLYAFWGDLVYRKLFAPGEPVINLASAEYARLVTPHLKPRDNWITCSFLVVKGGKRRCVTTAAKMAWGKMARYAVENRLDRPEDLKGFSWEGFVYEKALSGKYEYTFLRT